MKRKLSYSPMGDPISEGKQSTRQSAKVFDPQENKPVVPIESGQEPKIDKVINPDDMIKKGKSGDRASQSLPIKRPPTPKDPKK
jgi:hypothetical protein